MYEIIKNTINDIDEKFIEEASSCLPEKFSNESKKQITINAEDLVEMKKQIKKSNLIAKIAGIAAAFVCVAAVSVFFIMNNNGVQVLGGISSDYNESKIEDPFITSKPDNPFAPESNENEESKPGDELDSATQQTMEKSLGTFITTVNDNNRELIYDGNEMTLSVEIKAGSYNKYDITAGLSIYVDGLLQSYEIDGKPTEMLITDSMKANDKVTYEIKLDPVVTAEAAEKSELPIQIVTYLNPDYVPSEQSPPFGNAHHARTEFTASLTLNKKPQKISEAEFSEKSEKTLLTQSDVHDTSVIFVGTVGDETGVYRIKDGKLDYELQASWKKSEVTTYRISFYKNNKLITFDGGKSYINFTNNPGYSYSFKPDFDDEIKRGDFIYALAVPYSYSSDCFASTVYSVATLCVNSDFTYKNPETSSAEKKEESEVAPDNAEPEKVSYSDFCDNIIVDGKNMQILSNDEEISIVDIDSDTVYATLKLSDANFTLPKEAVQINEEITESNQMGWDKIDISRVNEESSDYYSLECSFNGYDVAVSGKYIAIKQEIQLTSDGKAEHYGNGYQIYDSDFRLVALTFSNFGHFTDDKKWITIEYKIDSNGTIQEVLHTINPQGEKSKLCELPTDLLISSIEKTENGYVMVRQESSAYARGAVAIDLSGNIVDEIDHTSINDYKQITVGSVTVFHNIGQKSIESYESGLCGTDVLIFDSEDNEFRKIKVNHLAEGRGVNLSSDGKELITYHVNADENSVIIRCYDIKTGEMTGESINKYGLNSVYAVAVSDEYATIMGRGGNERVKYR
ncbi:MAG: hypothetical protein J6D27_02325 [Ruminiclostridium sp.]|nr:hypothetical protein [Ruminiclostridium sp.]